MKKILVCLLAILFFGVPLAFGLSIGDEYYLGSVVPSQPADGNDQARYIEALIGLALGGTTNVEGSGPPGNTNNLVTRSLNEFVDLPDPIFSERSDTGTVWNFTNMNFAYVLGKYGTDSYIWYVSGLTNFFVPQSVAGSGGLSHTSFFNPTTQVPEPSTLLLIGAGIAGLAIYRRKSERS